MSIDRLVDALWDTSPPRSAGKNIQVYVWHLRKLLARVGAPGCLVHEPYGYRISLRTGELDLSMFEETLHAARAARAQGAIEQAADLFRDALARWRGRALADLLTMPALSTESAHLEEVRLSTIHEWLDLETILGHYSTVIKICADAIRDHPFHEYLRVYQILALHLAGRQAEALAAYDSIRVLLAEEMGLEPAPALRGLQAHILSGELMTIDAVNASLKLHGGIPTERCSDKPVVGWDSPGILLPSPLRYSPDTIRTAPS